MQLIDFSECRIMPGAYGGASGKKIAIKYDDEVFMLKFSDIADYNPNMSYSNSCYSEYLGCKIFESVQIPVQKTLLGLYNGKLVVACKDFTGRDIRLYDFASIKNTTMNTGHNGAGTDLSDILKTIHEQKCVEVSLMEDRFWDTFIIDALIGNWDRHNGNWGIVYDYAISKYGLAPVYDCGSCLFPQADENIMLDILENNELLNSKVYNQPLSTIKRNGKKINYFYFISSLRNQECNEALKRIVPRIDLENINSIIDDMPVSDLQKQFYKVILKERKEKILDFSYNKLISTQSNQIRKMNIEV